MRRQQFLRIWFREYLPDYTILIWPQALSTNWVACQEVLAVHNVQLANWAYCLMASWRRQNIARIVYSAVKQMQFKNVFAEYSVTWALFCYNNIVYFAASIVFQSIDDNHWSNIFFDTGVSRSVHHLCMTPCIIWHANKIFHDQYVRKCDIFTKFTEIIDCKFLQYAVLDNWPDSRQVLWDQITVLLHAF